jgi:hypothetical protein
MKNAVLTILVEWEAGHTAKRGRKAYEGNPRKSVTRRTPGIDDRLDRAFTAKNAA